MNDLIRRVAIALAASDEQMRPKHQQEWDRLSDPLQRQYLDNARAAVSAVLQALIDSAPDNADIHTEEGFHEHLADWLHWAYPERDIT